MHKLIITRTNTMSGKVTEEIEEFYSIYNAEARKTNLIDEVKIKKAERSYCHETIKCKIIRGE
jgi:hypothetical protein